LFDVLYLSVPAAALAGLWSIVPVGISKPPVVGDISIIPPEATIDTFPVLLTLAAIKPLVVATTLIPADPSIITVIFSP
jgi:hypothetical protein